jgi:hypothetical protein
VKTIGVNTNGMSIGGKANASAGSRPAGHMSAGLVVGGGVYQGHDEFVLASFPRLALVHAMFMIEVGGYILPANWPTRNRPRSLLEQSAWIREPSGKWSRQEDVRIGDGEQ